MTEYSDVIHCGLASDPLGDVRFNTAGVDLCITQWLSNGTQVVRLTPPQIAALVRFNEKTSLTLPSEGA